MADADPQIKPKAAEPVILKPAFAVRLSAFLKVKPFVSKEDTRYYLNGVHVSSCQDDGALCVATDGHHLGVQRDPDGACWQEVICKIPDQLKAPRARDFLASPWLVCMALGSKGHLSLVEPAPKRDEDTADNAVARVDEALLRFGRVLIDGTYPDWRRVIPAATDGKGARSFNAQYLKSFGDYVRLDGADEMAPHLVLTQDKDFVGVLMPMRWDGQHTAPAWVSQGQPS